MLKYVYLAVGAAGLFCATLLGASAVLVEMGKPPVLKTVEVVDFKCDEMRGYACVVTGGRGGTVLLHERVAQKMIQALQPLQIRGFCASACTVVVDMLEPYGLVCATPDSVFKFHQPFFQTAVGRIPMPQRYTYVHFAPMIAARGGLPIQTWLDISGADSGLPVCEG